MWGKCEQRVNAETLTEGNCRFGRRRRPSRWIIDNNGVYIVTNRRRIAVYIANIFRLRHGTAYPVNAEGFCVCTCGGRAGRWRGIIMTQRRRVAATMRGRRGGDVLAMFALSGIIAYIYDGMRGIITLRDGRVCWWLPVLKWWHANTSSYTVHEYIYIICCTPQIHEGI